MGMQAVDLAIENGVDLDGTPIPQKMLDLYNRIMDEENKRQRSGCLLYTSPSPRDSVVSRMPSSA